MMLIQPTPNIISEVSSSTWSLKRILQFIFQNSKEQRLGQEKWHKLLFSKSGYWDADSIRNCGAKSPTGPRSRTATPLSPHSSWALLSQHVWCPAVHFANYFCLQILKPAQNIDFTLKKPIPSEVLGGIFHVLKCFQEPLFTSISLSCSETAHCSVWEINLENQTRGSEER